MVSYPSIFQNVRYLSGISSFSNAATVTPSNTEDLAVTASALYIGVSGHIKVDMEGTGEAIVLKSVPVGILRGRFTRVYQTGTAATDIVALW
jgi:hypothetical protein